MGGWTVKHGFPANDRVTLTLDPDGVAQLRLTRADKLNALDDAMFDALIEAGHALFDMPGLRCVVLAGEGKGFCAGLDLASFAALAEDGPRLAERTHGSANRFQHAAMQWRKLQVPVIAAVHGVCFGGGLQIASAADIRVVAPDARLAVMEMKWGMVPDMGGFTLWRGVVRDDVLRELTYTNREFSGVEAVALGFATIADRDPLARATAIAREIASRSPSAIRAAKELFSRYLDLPPDQMLLQESIAQQKLLGSRNQREAVRSQIEGAPPDFTDP
jgi:enoyl-CoA hydratase/carnithine racemase